MKLKVHSSYSYYLLPHGCSYISNDKSYNNKEFAYVVFGMFSKYLFNVWQISYTFVFFL